MNKSRFLSGIAGSTFACLLSAAMAILLCACDADPGNYGSTGSGNSSNTSSSGDNKYEPIPEEAMTFWQDEAPGQKDEILFPFLLPAGQYGLNFYAGDNLYDTVRIYPSSAENQKNELLSCLYAICDVENEDSPSDLKITPKYYLYNIFEYTYSKGPFVVWDYNPPGY